MKAWITKYALTSGILCVNAEESGSGVRMISYRANSMTQYAHGEGKDWHRSEGAALIRVEKMRVAKIAALEKSIRKYRDLEFKKSSIV